MVYFFPSILHLVMCSYITIYIDFHIIIFELGLFVLTDKIQVNYVRSGGPGGQNVNCVSTKTEIRFHLASADWIPEPIRVKLAERVKNQISKEGYFIIKSERTRSQQLNLADTLDKLRNLIHSVAQSLVVPEVSQETLEKQRRL